MKNVYKIPTQKIISGNILIYAESEEEALEIAKEQRISDSDIVDRNIYLDECWEVNQYATSTIEITDEYEADECLNYEE